MSGGAIAFVAFCSVFPAIIVLAVVVKFVEVRRAKRWPSTTGKVIGSTVKSRVNKPGDPGYDFHDTEVTNEPLVEYEYTVGSKKYRCSRITIGEKTSASELEGILQRYPVGATVTVFYDPKDPKTALLERDIFDRKTLTILVVLVLVFLAGPWLAVFAYYRVEDWYRGQAEAEDHAPFLAALSCFGSLVLFFAIGYLGVIWQSSRWPTVRGKIIASETQAYSNRDTDDGARRTYYRPSVRYEYEVNGRKYQGDRVSIGVKVSGTLPFLARGLASRFAVGKQITIRYDPRAPGESVLKSFSPAYLLPLVVAIGLLVLAWAIATGRM